jgi:outer membrane protein insertion porin family
MTKIALRIFLFLIFLPVLYLAQNITKLEITGVKSFEAKEYISWCKLKDREKLTPLVIDSLQTRISSKLRERGYFFSSIKNYSYEKMDDSGSVVLKLDIDEGKPAYINDIFISGDSLNTERINREFENLHNMIFTKADVEKSISSVLDFHEENGYPFAKVNIKSVSLENDSLNNKIKASIYISIDKGRISRIDRIEIKGNTKTKEYVIARTTRIKPGTDYSQKDIDDIPDRLNKLLYFEPVSVPSYYINSKDEGILSIEIREKVTNNFDGIIGYVPANENDRNSRGYLTGLANISLRNLFGTGRAAGIKWQQIDRNSQELDIKYLEPWLFGHPFNVNLELYQLKQDTTYVQRKFESAVELLASSTVTASFIFTSASVVPTIRAIPVFTVYNSTTTSTGLCLKLDTRDDFYSPTEGFYFFNTYIYNKKKIYGPAKYLSSDMDLNINYQKFEVDFSYFKKLFSKNVIAVGLHGREMKGSDFEVSDLYKLGGANTLRGYKEQQFLGNRILWSNLESRLILARRTYAFLFFDSGYYMRQFDAAASTPKTEAFKYGYGLGLNIETGLGVMNVSYALGKGDSFSMGKIHFGLVSEF